MESEFAKEISCCNDLESDYKDIEKK